MSGLITQGYGVSGGGGGTVVLDPIEEESTTWTPIKRGDTLSRSFTIPNIGSADEVTMAFKQTPYYSSRPNEASELLFSRDNGLTIVAKKASSGLGEMTATGTTATIYAEAEATQQLPVGSLTADVQIKTGSVEQTILTITVEVTADVTRI